MQLTSRLAVGICGVLCGAAPAYAGGFTTARFGGEAGHAASDDVTSIYYNPAGISYGHGIQIYAEGLFAYRTVGFTRDLGAIDNPNTDSPSGTPTDGLAANAGPDSKATLGNLIVSPFVGAVYHLNDSIGVGAGVYVPFGGQAKWDQNSAFAGNTQFPGAVDGVQRWAAIEGEQRSLYYTLAAGWHRKDGKLAAGVGVNLVQSSVSLVRARNANGTDDLTAGGIVVEGRSLLEVSGFDLAASAGIMFEPKPDLRVGLSYQSQPGFGEQTLTGTLTNKFGTGPVSPLDVELRQTLPDVVKLAVSYRADAKVEVHAQADLQRWSVYQNQCIMRAGATGECKVNPDGSTDQDGIIVNLPRNWRNTYSLRGGARWTMNDKLELNGGLTYDSNAVPDATMDPSLFDMDKLIGEVGAHWKSGKLVIAGTLAHVYYNDRVTQPSVSLAPPSKNPDMAGKYESQVTYALVGVGVDL